MKIQQYEKMLDGTLDKYTGSDYIVVLKEEANADHEKPLTIPQFKNQLSRKKVID